MLTPDSQHREVEAGLQPFNSLEFNKELGVNRLDSESDVCVESKNQQEREVSEKQVNLFCTRYLYFTRGK